MEPNLRGVKARRYDSSRRQRQARETRDAIIGVARRRFLADGYLGTTNAKIARDAGVSVDTIYKTYGGKSGLVRAIHDESLIGDGPVSAEARSDTLQASNRDPRLIMRGIGRLAAEVAPRVAPIMLLIRDAALTDPAMRALKTELDGQRLRRMTKNAGSLLKAGHLRPGITARQAAEIMWTYSAPELYQLVVVDRGWSAQRYGDFVADALTAHLLPGATERLVD
jgi:AcrR family transcriptional regulator